MKEKLITVRESSQILGILEKDVIDLAKKGKIPSYYVGREFLRFPKEDILNLKEHIQADFNVLSEQPTFRERLYEFFYFNDFYIISFLIIAALLGLIIFT